MIIFIDLSIIYFKRKGIVSFTNKYKTMKISELKKDAKMKLSGVFKLAITINFIHLLITLVLYSGVSHVEGILNPIFSLIVSIIEIPLGFGLTACMLKLSRGEIVGVTDFISIGFKNFKRAFFLSFAIFFRLIVPIILLVVASVMPIVINFAQNIGAEPHPATNFISLCSLLVAVSSIIYLLYKILAYALTTYILVDNNEAKSKEVIAKSCELMKGQKTKYIGLILSFFGWLILSGLIGGVVAAFNEFAGNVIVYALSLLLTPYITFAEINFYEELSSDSKTVEAQVVDSTVE